MTRPPSGSPPPPIARLPGGDEVRLEPLAAEICLIYRSEYPDEQDRYGDAGMAWCIHDNQHILNWAMADLAGFVDLDARMAWLAGILERKDFPRERIVRNLEIAADIVWAELGEPATELARRLESAAKTLASPDQPSG